MRPLSVTAMMKEREEFQLSSLCDSKVPALIQSHRTEGELMVIGDVFSRR